MGYRHLNGVGVPESCPAAGAFYENAALAAGEWLDERRRRSVEHANPVDAEHLTQGHLFSNRVVSIGRWR